MKQGRGKREWVSRINGFKLIFYMCVFTTEIDWQTFFFSTFIYLYMEGWWSLLVLFSINTLLDIQIFPTLDIHYRETQTQLSAFGHGTAALVWLGFNFLFYNLPLFSNASHCIPVSHRRVTTNPNTASCGQSNFHWKCALCIQWLQRTCAKQESRAACRMCGKKDHLALYVPENTLWKFCFLAVCSNLALN